MNKIIYQYDVIVVGAGHAGTEAAASAARLGACMPRADNDNVILIDDFVHAISRTLMIPSSYLIAS